MQANTINEVIRYLDQVIETTQQENSRVGYFAALYRKTTLQIKNDIQAGRFEDSERMEQLDVLFANRYLEAYTQYKQGKPPTGAWRVAFQAANSWPPIVLQHLLLGMNAHINLDLGIAAAQTAPGDQLPALKNDFHQINQVLASLVGEVKEELATIWPTLRWLDELSGTVEDVIVNFSMTKARDHAWRTAEKLAPLSEDEQIKEITKLDAWVEGFGMLVWKPRPLTRLAGLAIRLTERRGVQEIIDILR